MAKYRITAILILVAAVAVGWFVYATEVDGEDGRFDFKLGLDLAGGTQLTYGADTSSLEEGEIDDAMSALRDVIERRVNAFGVSEPNVQVEQGGIFGADDQEQRLIVELPGVTDVEEAKEQIGRTPLLEFKLLTDPEALAVSSVMSSIGLSTTSSGQPTATVTPTEGSVGEAFTETGLTGQFLESAQLQFDPTSGQPVVLLNFNKEGGDLFEEITRENIGVPLGIFLDEGLVSSPVIQDAISGGTATITGLGSAEEARDLVRDLNLGALPVPITLIQEQTVGPSLGKVAVDAGLKAGVVGFILVVLFLILWYRLPGLLASIALSIYLILMLALFKLIPVTLTSAGIAGLILSLGMAVDANILIFERFKEELRSGKSMLDSVQEGVSRAWLSIRDGNLSTIITAVILFYATTSLVKGFALVLAIGVLVSMFTAIIITRTFLLAVIPNKEAGSNFFFNSGIHR
jgi:protein-export membrane protein SecD